jgi:hypothetical protein
MLSSVLLLQAIYGMPPVAGVQLKWGVSVTELVNDSGGAIQEIPPTASRFYGF